MRSPSNASSSTQSSFTLEDVTLPTPGSQPTVPSSAPARERTAPLVQAGFIGSARDQLDVAEKGEVSRGNGSYDPSPEFEQATGLPAPKTAADAFAEKKELEHPRSAMGTETDNDKSWEVSWEPGESANPMNWSFAKKWYLTAVGGLLVLNSSFASSAPGGVVPQMSRVFGMNEIEGTLVISIMVGGYVVGPLFWGPLSETYGRRPLFIISFAAFTLLQIGSALAPNTGAVLAFRFLSGVAAACPLTNAGSILGDMFDANTRGKAVSIFVVAPFSGPALGPIVGGFIEVAGLKWYWLFWVLCAFAGLCTVIVFFTLPETYTPVLLVQKAKRLRKETGDDRWYAPLEKKKAGFAARANDVLVRPFVMLFEEPMLLCITLYMSFLYGILYLNFVAYPIIFELGHGMNAGISGLMFLPLFLGSIAAACFSIFYINPRYISKSAAWPPYKAPPELRLESALPGAVILPISMFWLAWTSYDSVHWIAPCLSGFALGVGLILVFLALFSYIIDCYLMSASTALAATTVVRSLFGFGFPLFGRQMYTTLNPRWAGSTLGFIALLFAPIPFLFLRYGERIRALSKNAVAR